jgi:carboxymethylenebutenolidase
MENDDLTRRDFVSMTVAAGLAAAAGADLSAQQVTETNVEIKTPDGTCDAAFIHPASGAHPAVIIWPDAFGLRPSMREMAKRLAMTGDTVLVPNRVGAGASFHGGALVTANPNSPTRR